VSLRRWPRAIAFDESLGQRERRGTPLLVLSVELDEGTFQLALLHLAQPHLDRGNKSALSNRWWLC
jgi:hypothetical protein